MVSTVLFFLRVEINFQYSSILCYIGPVEEELHKSQNTRRVCFSNKQWRSTYRIVAAHLLLYTMINRTFCLEFVPFYINMMEIHVMENAGDRVLLSFKDRFKPV